MSQNKSRSPFSGFCQAFYHSNKKSHYSAPQIKAMQQLVIYLAQYKCPTVSPKTTSVHSLHAGPPPWDSQKALDQAEVLSHL